MHRNEESMKIFLNEKKSEMIEQLQGQYANEIGAGTIGLVVVPRNGRENALEILDVFNYPFSYAGASYISPTSNF
jgi:hypothetical protein